MATNELMESVGEEERFSELFRQHGRALYGHIRTLVPHPHDADDVFQETSSVLWNKFSDYQPNTNFLAWACQIAHFKALKLRERHYRAPLLFGTEFQELISEEVLAAADNFDARSAALRQCRDKLNKSDREILERYYRPKSTAKSVAKNTRRSVHHVYRSMRRIHSALHKCISESLLQDSRP